MLRAIVVFLAASLLSACTGGGSSSSDPAPTPFQVSSVLPADGSSNVSLMAEVDVIFTQPVDPQTLDKSSFRVVAESGDVILGTRSVPPLNASLVRFVPSTGYFPYAVHRIEVSTGVRDEAGKPLDKSYTFEFQTEGSADVLVKQDQIHGLGNRLAVGRWFHRMTPLADGRILIAGGYASSNTVTDTAELLSPANGTSSLLAAHLTKGRAAHVQVALGDGRVLLAGGETSDTPFVPTSTCEIFDPAAETFTAAASMSEARSFAQGVLLPDGEVLVSGGESVAQDGSFVFLDDAEIYDPDADTWRPAASLMTQARAGHFSALRADGTVLCLGGTPGLPSADVFDPASGTFHELSGALYDHYLGAGTVLFDGRAFVAGGYGSTGVTIDDPQFGLLGATNAMQNERTFATATALPDGRVLIVGGTDYSQHPPVIQDTLDVFFPIGHTGKVVRVQGVTLPQPLSHHAAAYGSDGAVWLTGGLPSDTTQPGLREVTRLVP